MSGQTQWRKVSGAAVTMVVTVVGLAGPALAGPPSAEGTREVDPVLIPAGQLMTSVATGDVDNDGIVDIVAAGRHPESIHVLLGQGGGAFAGPLRTHVGEDLGDLLLSDFDADGNLDVAVLPFFAEPAVLVLPGLGDGRFSASTSYPVGMYPASLSAADVDGDGDDDLLASSEGSDSVDVLLGDGGLGFVRGQSVAVGDRPAGLDVADLNADGDPDFAVANSAGNTVSLRYGDGTGAFDQGVEVPVRSAPEDVVIADADDDGRLDLVVGSNDDDVTLRGTLAVLKGTSPFAYTEVRSYRTLKVVNEVAVADFDQDGAVDVVAATGSRCGFGCGFNPQGPGYVTIALGRPGQGTDVILSMVGDAATDLALDDLDGDGDLDILSTRGMQYVAVVVNNLS